MKTASFLLLTTVLTLVVILPLKAGSGYGPDINAPSDGDPSDSSQPRQRQATPSEQAAAQKQQDAKNAEDKDWLYKSYQKLQSGDQTTSSGDQDDNLYTKVSNNKELAKLAGIATTDSDAQDPTKAFRTGVADSGKASLSLRSDPTEAKSARTSLTQFKPLITPLSFFNGMTSAYGARAGTSQTPIVTSSHTDSDSIDPTSIDTPGLTAAERDPLFDKNADLRFDITPDDSLPGSKSRDSGQLPSGSNEEALHNMNAMALKAPGATVKPYVAPPANPPKIEVPQELEPSRVITVSPVRQPIADPHDIFFH